MIIGLYLMNNNSPFPAYNVVVRQRKLCSDLNPFIRRFELMLSTLAESVTPTSLK